MTLLYFLFSNHIWSWSILNHTFPRQLLEQSKTVPTSVSYDVDFAEIDMSESKEEVRLLKLFFPEKFSAPGSDYEAIKLVSLDVGRGL